MNYDIKQVEVCYDHLTFTSDDRRKLVMDNEILKPYYDVLSITNHKKSSKSYPYYSGFIHKETGNQVKCFYERNNDNWLPNIVLEFNSSWERPLTCSEVAFVLNRFIEVFNVGFNLSEFHVTTDLYSKKNYIQQLAGCTKSRRRFDPPEAYKDPKLPKALRKSMKEGTYYFQCPGSDFYLVLYDKGKQLKKKKWNTLSTEAKRALKGWYVARFEARFDNTQMNLITSFDQLATSDLSFMMPEYLQFRQPNSDKFKIYGLKPKHWKGLGLKAIRELLRAKGVRNNFFKKLEDQPDLTNVMGDALLDFRWCTCDEKCTLIKPKLAMNPPMSTFKKLRKEDWCDE